MFLGRDYPQRFGLVDWAALNRRARAALAPLGIDHVAPETSVSRLSVGDRMLIKIAGAFLEDEAAPARIFVMDEPTAALNGEESGRLLRLIEALHARGCGIIYVSHRLDEVLAIADTISLLRDGETRATLPAKEVTKTKLVELMTGRDAREAGSARLYRTRPGRALCSESRRQGLHGSVLRSARGRNPRRCRSRRRWRGACDHALISSGAAGARCILTARLSCYAVPTTPGRTGSRSRRANAAPRGCFPTTTSRQHLAAAS